VQIPKLAYIDQLANRVNQLQCSRRPGASRVVLDDYSNTYKAPHSLHDQLLKAKQLTGVRALIDKRETPQARREN
jgi:hypothetical protein